MMAVSAPPIFSSFAERVLFEKDTQYKLIHLKNRSWFRERYLQQLSTAYETIYTAIGEDGPRVIVDSSKIPQMNLLLRQMSSIDVYYLHIVRDSRAVTYSESFRKKQQISTSHGAKEMSLPLWLSTWRWRRINRQSELLQDGSRFLRIRYESLLKEPEVTLAQILRFVAEDEAAIPQNRVFPVGELHMFSGNPGRMTGPSVTLKPDVEWQERYPQIQRGLVTAATWRQLHRYGYL